MVKIIERLTYPTYSGVCVCVCVWCGVVCAFVRGLGGGHTDVCVCTRAHVLRNGVGEQVLASTHKHTHAHTLTDTRLTTEFLMTYRSFCTAREFLDLLLLRYRVPEPPRLTPAQSLLLARRLTIPVQTRSVRLSLDTALSFCVCVCVCACTLRCVCGVCARLCLRVSAYVYVCVGGEGEVPGRSVALAKSGKFPVPA